MNGLDHETTTLLARKLERIFSGPEHGVCRMSDIDRLSAEVIRLLQERGYKCDDGYVIPQLLKENPQ